MKRWSLLGAGAGAALASCLTIPPFRPPPQPDAGVDAAVDAAVDTPACTPSAGNGGVLTYTVDGAGASVAGPSYFVHFASNGSQFHFPDAVRINGVDLIGQRGTSCQDEDEVGVALYPAASVHANGSATVGANDLITTPGWLGPAVVKLNVHWSTSYACDTTQTPAGFSLFTLFPDGRIHRHDRIDNSGSVDWVTCDCASSASSYYPTTFWTFLQAPFTELFTRSGSNAQLPSNFGGGFLFPGVSACLSSNLSRRVAIAWANNQTRVRAPVTTAGSETVALVYDFIIDHGTTTVNGFSYETASVLLLASDNVACTDPTNGGLARAEAALANQGLLVNNTLRVKGTYDGIYGGAMNASGNGGIDVGTTATLGNSAIPSGFAVWLRFSDPTCDVDIVKTNSGAPITAIYTKQQIDPDEWVIWFHDALAANQTITVTAR